MTRTSATRELTGNALSQADGCGVARSRITHAEAALQRSGSAAAARRERETPAEHRTRLTNSSDVVALVVGEVASQHARVMQGDVVVAARTETLTSLHRGSRPTPLCTVNNSLREETRLEHAAGAIPTIAGRALILDEDTV